MVQCRQCLSALNFAVKMSRDAPLWMLGKQGMLETGGERNE